MRSTLPLVGFALALAGAAQAQAPSQQLPLLPAPGCGACAAPAGATGAAGAAPQATAPAEAAPRLLLRGVRFTGASVVGQDALQALAQPYLGREVGLDELQALAAAVAGLYHQRGYFLAQALVPVQNVQDGVVEISVVEGRIARLDVQRAPEAPVSEARVRAMLAPLAQGEAVRAQDYERAMLLLSDQPGLRVGSTLQDGATPGTLDLDVEVNPGPRWSFAADADNQGTQESGRYRVGGTARWASPLGLGDNLDLRAMVGSGSALQLGRVAYEVPLGADGLRLGMGLARVRYELGGEFAALGAQGRATVADVSLSYPVIRQRQHNLFLRLLADSKRLQDEYTAVDYATRKRVQGAGLGWAWERRDGWGGGGYWASAGTLYHGRLSLRDGDSLAADQAPGGLQTGGGFTKFSFQLSRLQAVAARHSLYLVLGGQRANKNLDASEKLALGGARAVRAYPAGEVLVDQGLIGSVEWRWAATAELTPFVFYDAARGDLDKNPSPLGADGQRRSLRGAGLGLNWARAGSFTLNATLAWRAGTPPPLTDGARHGPRLYLQLQKQF